MKKLVLILLSIFLAFTFSKAQNGHINLKYKEKYCFINSTPAAEYTVVGKAKFVNSKKNVARAGADPSGIKSVLVGVEAAIKKVEKGKQEDFDAFIAYSPIKIELIKFNDVKLENILCHTASKGYLKKKCGTKDIFFVSRPYEKYEEVKIITVENFTNLGQLKYGKNSIDNFLNKLYERSCKEAKKGVDFDAIILDDDNILVNGFLSTKTIILIKYK